MTETELQQGQNETRRRFYLQALGVDLYFPRSALPGALPSRSVQAIPFDLDNQALAGNASQNLKLDKDQSKAVEVPSLEGISKTVNKDQNEKTSPIKRVTVDLETPVKNKNKTTSEKSIDQAKQTIVQYAIRVWRVKQDLLILDCRDSTLALPTDTLLSNIVMALGYEKSELNKFDSLRWQHNHYLSSEENEKTAREAVQAYIDAQQQNAGFETVLLFGLPAYQYSVAATDYQGEKGLWQKITLNENCRGIVLPALATLLQQPSLKKNTWHCIKHLHA